MTLPHPEHEHPLTSIDTNTVSASEVVARVKGRVADFAAMHSLPHPRNMTPLDRSLLAERILERRHALRGGTIGFSEVMGMHGSHEAAKNDESRSR